MYGLSTIARSPWSIFDELESLQQDLNRAFTGRGRAFEAPARQRAYPPMNVWSSAEGVIVDAELPGADPANINISVSGDELTLSGKTAAADVKETAVLHRSERRTGEFVRVLQLPFRADGNAVKAQYRNGILRLTVPRSEEEKPRKIAIEAA